MQQRSIAPSTVCAPAPVAIAAHIIRYRSTHTGRVYTGTSLTEIFKAVRADMEKRHATA